MTKTARRKPKRRVDIENIRKDIKERKVEKESAIDISKLGISTGSTLLNLALTDNPYYGYILRRIVNLIGDSSSGKTLLLWIMFAEICMNKRFNDYRIIYDEPECALSFDFNSLFKKNKDILKKRVEMEEKNVSDDIGDFYNRIIDIASSKSKFIYGLDSFDSLDELSAKKGEITVDDEEDNEENEEEDEEFDNLKTRKKKTKVKIGYQTVKPIILSQILRKIKMRLKETDSLLFVISQTRDKIGVTFGKKKTRSGGRALRFYSTHEIWLAIKSHIRRCKEEIGVNVIARVEKNKITGKCRTVEFPIYNDYGVDDITSCAKWLIDKGFWKRYKKEGVDTGDDFGILQPKELITKIEEENLENKLKEIVGKRWLEVEEKIKTNRKSRY